MESMIYCGDHLWMCDRGEHFVEAPAGPSMECSACREKYGETQSPVSVAESGAVTTDGKLYCSPKCANDAHDLNNRTDRTPNAEGTCARCGAWINDPFARSEEV